MGRLYPVHAARAHGAEQAIPWSNVFRSQSFSYNGETSTADAHAPSDEVDTDTHHVEAQMGWQWAVETVCPADAEREAPDTHVLINERLEFSEHHPIALSWRSEHECDVYAWDEVRECGLCHKMTTRTGLIAPYRCGSVCWRQATLVSPINSAPTAVQGGTVWERHKCEHAICRRECTMADSTC